MDIEWDKEEPSSISWDDEPAPKDTSLVGQAKEFGTNLGGGLMAGIDMAASIPGMVGAGTAALTHATGIGDESVTTGRSPKEFLGEVMQSSQEGNPLNMLPDDYTALRKTEGYEAVNKLVGGTFEAIGQGYGNIAAAVSPKGMEGKVGEMVDAVAEASLLAAGFMGGKGGPKPGTVEFAKANAPIKPEAAPTAYRSGFPLDYEPGQKLDVRRSGEFDPTLTETQIPRVNVGETVKDQYEPTLTTGYQYKNKQTTDRLATSEIRGTGDMKGIDFTTFELEDPKQIDHLVETLGSMGVKADSNEARTLAAQMKVKSEVADEQAKPMAHTITKRIKAMAMRAKDIVDGLTQINSSPMFNAVELVDTRLMELMRNQDRLTNPKGLNQFIEKETSVLNNGVNKGLPLMYWPEEGRIVQANGNTRRGVAAKHGMAEIPTYVRVMEGRVPEEYQKTAVSLPGLKWEGKTQGQIVRPSEIGLPSRTLNEGVFDPRIKYAPDPTVSPTIKMPAGHFQNNYLWEAQHDKMQGLGVRKGLEIVRDRSQTPWYREVAKLLLEDPKFNPEFRVKDTFGKKEKLGVFWLRAYRMEIAKASTGNEYVFVHEAIHGRTQGLIEQMLRGDMERSHPAYEPTRKLIELWQNLKEHSEDNLVDAYKGSPEEKSPLYRIFDEYGLTNAHEFIAEAFTNPEFQNLLKQIELPKGYHVRNSGFKYYWDVFLTSLGQLIGIKPTDNNYLRATLEAGAEMMRMSTKEDRMFYAYDKAPENWYHTSFTGVKSADFMSNMIDAKQIQSVDRRALQEVVNDKQLNAENFKDLDNGTKGDLLSRVWGTTKLFGRNLADARTIQLLNKAVIGAGDLLKNIGDRTFLSDRWMKGQIEETMKGKEYKAWQYDPRGFQHRLGSLDGIDPTFKHLTEEDGKTMLKTWLPKIGKKELERSDFANDRQWNAAQNISNQLNKAFSVVNDLRVKIGLPTIERIKGFFPASRGRGDYKVVIKDSMGNTRDLTTFENVYEANKHVKDMRNKFPTMEVSEPFHRERYRPDETDYTVWAEAERINNADNEISKLIQQAKAVHFTKYGMGGHLLKRKVDESIGGYLGSDYNPKAAREGLQQYFEYLYNYAGNLHKGLIEKELNELRLSSEDGKGQPLSKIAPNLDEYLHQFLEKSKGAHNVYDQSEQIFFGLATKALGFGESAPTRGMAKISRAAMVWYLFKMPFFASQPFQTFNALPHLVEMKGMAEGSRHFLEGWQRTFFPSMEDKAIVNWAVKHEYIDPTTSHVMDEYNTSLPTRIFLKTSGIIERELVRIPALLMYEHALKDVIRDPEKRYEAAAEKMAYSMSMTNKSNSPLVWEKLGIVGQGMRQLKSYSTNIWGQFAYFMQQAGTKSDFKPLGTFLATEALVGGVKGVIGIAEATALITVYNYLTNSNVKTPEEWMITNKKPDWATYGLASTVVGRDISNQVGNPSGFNYLDPIPFKFALGVTEANISYGIALAQNQLTDSIRLKTWLANTPTALHEWIRNWFTKTGQPTPNPNINMQGTYYREKKPYNVDTAAITGARSVEETKADALQRLFKQHEQRLTQNRSQTQNSMVDDVLNGQMIAPDKIQSYVFQGGNPRNLASDLKNTLMQRNRSAIFNEIMQKGRSTTQAQKLRDVGPYLDNQPANIFPSSRETTGTIEWDSK